MNQKDLFTSTRFVFGSDIFQPGRHEVAKTKSKGVTFELPPSSRQLLAAGANRSRPRL